jgi:ribonuclease HIII
MTAARIGIDESGKGDYYGPLVIGAVYVDGSTEGALTELGVRDSKKVSDKRAAVLAAEIKKRCPHHSVVAIGPRRYNELYEKIGNLNKLLAWGHARALENVLEKTPCARAVSDQFGDERFILNALLKNGKAVALEQRHRAEEDIAVAAASLLARAEFLERLGRLSQEQQIAFPKGASDPKILILGRELVKAKGEAALAEVAKLHFKTTKQILAG